MNHISILILMLQLALSSMNLARAQSCDGLCHGSVLELHNTSEATRGFARAKDAGYPNNGILNHDEFTIEVAFQALGPGFGFGAGGPDTDGVHLVSKVFPGKASPQGPFALRWSSANEEVNFSAIFGPGGGGRADLSSGIGSAVSGIWHHAAVTYDGTNLTLYLNGAQVATRLHGLGFFDQSPGAFLHFGAAEAGGGFYRRFHGRMDEVRIWNQALSQATIIANMTRILPPSSPGLLGYWNFEGSRINDHSPLKNHGAKVQYVTFAGCHEPATPDFGCVPRLTLSQGDAGERATLLADCVTPGGQVFWRASVAGPGPFGAATWGGCSGLCLELSPTFVHAGSETADVVPGSSSTACISVPVPVSVPSRVWIQALDAATCRVTNAVELCFP